MTRILDGDPPTPTAEPKVPLYYRKTRPNFGTYTPDPNQYSIFRWVYHKMLAFFYLVISKTKEFLSYVIQVLHFSVFPP